MGVCHSWLSHTARDIIESDDLIQLLIVCSCSRYSIKLHQHHPTLYILTCELVRHIGAFLTRMWHVLFLCLQPSYHISWSDPIIVFKLLDSFIVEIEDVDNIYGVIDVNDDDNSIDYGVIALAALCVSTNLFISQGTGQGTDASQKGFCIKYGPHFCQPILFGGTSSPAKKKLPFSMSVLCYSKSECQ